MRIADQDGEALAGPGAAEGERTEQIERQAKYAGYVTRQREEVEKQAAQEGQLIPADIDYDALSSLSMEVRQRLKASRPETVGQDSRVSGVTPAALSLLLIQLKRRPYGQKAAR